MTLRNENFSKVSPSYLFSQVRKKKEIFEKNHPEIPLLSLGIGDTTEPLVEPIVSALHEAAKQLGNASSYLGYGPELGYQPLKESISSTLYTGRRSASEIIVTDGAKCDIGRLQILFGTQVPTYVLDPSYPVYHDSSCLIRQTHPIRLTASIKENFVPDLSDVKQGSLIFLCSPNNPTGKVFSRDELASLITIARNKRCIIIYDVAYQAYIQSTELPQSIFEIEGADEVAIEIGSFSKMAGLSGVRLGWIALSTQLKWDSGEALIHDIERLYTTIFNGASYLSQQAGLAALSEHGYRAIKKQVHAYLHRAALLKKTLQECQLTVFGGNHSPYLWCNPNLGSSWETFDTFLSHGLITTPGIGFGSAGEGFIRLSSFQSLKSIEEACDRIRVLLQKSNV